MNNEIILSVIIPVFNSEKYLNELFNSLIQNDLKNILPTIQFNLISKCIVINNLMFISMHILQAINKQVEELEWNKC